MQTVNQDNVQDVDDEWPNVLLLLEPGRVVFKEYSEEHGGRLFFFDYGNDALLAFTNALLQAVADRTVATEEQFYLTRYAIDIVDVEPYAVLGFSLTRFMPGRTPLWE
jgi:hypothetical protein